MESRTYSYMPMQKSTHPFSSQCARSDGYRVMGVIMTAVYTSSLHAGNPPLPMVIFVLACWTRVKEGLI